LNVMRCIQPPTDCTAYRLRNGVRK
jgi:hypothetical protein